MTRLGNVFIPLVWEHEEALTLSATIQRSLEDLDSSTLDPEALRLMVFDLWERRLFGHFDDVASVFNPAARIFGAEGNALADRVEREHRDVALDINLLKMVPGDFLHKLGSLADRLRKYVEFERDTFFPFLNDKLSDQAKARLGEQLINRRMKAGRGSTDEEAAVRGGA